MGSRKDVTLTEIATRAGVSISTVSRALGESPSVRPELRRQIRAIAEELGYEPTGSPARGEVRSVGVIVPSIKVPYYARLVTGVARVAETNGVDLRLRLARYRPDNAARHIAILADGGADGLIVISPRADAAIEHPDLGSLPLVFLDHPAGPQANAVVADEHDAALQAARYLVSLGHRDLLYLYGPDVDEGRDAKREGLAAGLASAGLSLPADRLLGVPALQIEPTIPVVTERLRALPSVSAVVASDDLLAFGAMRAARELGRHAPESISILGLNGNRMSAGLDLTTVMMPAGQMGRAAMQLLLDLMESRVKAPQRIELKGASSCAARAGLFDRSIHIRRYEIEYSTYLGGNEWDQMREIIPYPDGSVLVGGMCVSTNMPTSAGALQPRYTGDTPADGHRGVHGGTCYLARLSPDLGELVAATHFGGSRQERAIYGMELDRDGNIVFASTTRSPDLPTTSGSFCPTYRPGRGDIFVAKMSGDLTRLLWCTFVGGGNSEPRGGIQLDRDDNVCVVGMTTDPEFPTTPGAFQRDYRGELCAVAFKLAADGSDLIFSTFLGGANSQHCRGGVRLDDGQNLCVFGATSSPDFPVTSGVYRDTHPGGHCLYYARLAADGSRLMASTFFGGSDRSNDEHRLLRMPDGSLVCSGPTHCADFPTTPGAVQRERAGTMDAFVTRISEDGSRLLFSTLLGGAGGRTNLYAPKLTKEGTIVLFGHTDSPRFPVTGDAIQTRYSGGPEVPLAHGWGNAVILELSPDGREIVYSTFLGGSGVEHIRGAALGPEGEIYLVGNTFSDDFPVTPGAFQTKKGAIADGFVTKLVRV